MNCLRESTDNFSSISVRLWAPLGVSKEEFYQKLKILIDNFNSSNIDLLLKACAEPFYQKLGELIDNNFCYKQCDSHYQELEKLIKELDESIKKFGEEHKSIELNSASSSELNQDLKKLAIKRRSDDRSTYEKEFYQKSKGNPPL